MFLASVLKHMSRRERRFSLTVSHTYVSKSVVAFVENQRGMDMNDREPLTLNLTLTDQHSSGMQEEVGSIVA